MSGACVELITDEQGRTVEVWIDGARITDVDNATVLAEPNQRLQLVITVNVQCLLSRSGGLQGVGGAKL